MPDLHTKPSFCFVHRTGCNSLTASALQDAKPKGDFARERSALAGKNHNSLSPGAGRGLGHVGGPRFGQSIEHSAAPGTG